MIGSFEYTRAQGIEDAPNRGAMPRTAFIAGGTDLLQLLKTGVIELDRVVDISHLPLQAIAYSDSSLSIGSSARLSDIAAQPDIVRDHPLIAEAILATASGQIRNMATLGGNLLQRTRCPYFRNQDLACNKRRPGSGCGALLGENRQAALFGGSAACVATHASDLAVALSALDAEVEVSGKVGPKRFRLQDFYRLPADRPEADTELGIGDLITRVLVRKASRFARRSTYLKIRDRASFEFSVVSVAAMLRIEDGVIVEARLAAGGVAPLPWRLIESEASLVGRVPDALAFAVAGDLAVEGARSLDHNGFKIGLLRNAVIRSLQTVGDSR